MSTATVTGSSSQERIKRLLGTGLNVETVANAVGLTPSYISQLMSDPGFASEVTLLRSEALTAATERDHGIDDIEKKLITKLGEVVDIGGFYKAQDVLKALMIVNNMKRRGVAAVGNPNAQQAVVSLNMPTILVQNFVTTPQGEVIEIDGKTLVPMQAGTLLKTLAARSTDDATRYERIRNFLPEPGQSAEEGGNIKDVGENHRLASQGIGAQRF